MSSVTPTYKDQSHGDVRSNVPEIQTDPSNNEQPETFISTTIKRQRTTRACDECRRRKVKCNGKQLCLNCKAYDLECTYDKPSGRQRYQTRQYIESLEKRLQRAEMLLQKHVPDIDLDNLTVEHTEQPKPPQLTGSRAKIPATEENPPVTTPTEDKPIITLTESIGQLDLTEEGEWDFHGLSSGAVFLGRLSEHIPGLLGQDTRMPFLPRAPRPSVQLSLDSPRYLGDNYYRPGLDAYSLPSQDLARTLSDYSLNCATCLTGIVHAPSFYRLFDSLYEKPANMYTNEEHRFLGLFYAVLALGSMYDVDENNPYNPNHYAVAMDEGFKYYILARSFLPDLTECRDMITLQALLFIVQFLQATSNLSGCHAFIGIALRAALRMGLHRHLPHARITPIEDESRRRVFHAIRQMDTYMSAILGLPILLDDADIDQPLPTEVNDEFINERGILTPPSGTPSYFEAFNAHTKLMGILAKIIKLVYPPKGINQSVVEGKGTQMTYVVSYARIKEIEQDLQSWYEQLPITWRPGLNGPIQVVRIRVLLRFAYAHVQMMLYRPFLHYISQQSAGFGKKNDQYYTCAAAGISVCRNIVHIGSEIRKQAVLIGPYWFSMYTQFFAVLSLLVYVLNNPDIPGLNEILSDAQLGREVIASLTCRSLAADRVAKTLNSLFDQLVDRLKDRKGRSLSEDRIKIISQLKPPAPSNEQLQFSHMPIIGPPTNSDDVNFAASSSFTKGHLLNQESHGLLWESSINKSSTDDAMMFALEYPFTYPNRSPFTSNLGSVGEVQSGDEDLLQLSLPLVYGEIQNQFRKQTLQQPVQSNAQSWVDELSITNLSKGADNQENFDMLGLDNIFL